MRPVVTLVPLCAGALRGYVLDMSDWIANHAPWLAEQAPSAAFLIWFAYVGGCIGSFLNVVYYRLPRGEDIVYRGSRCPACETPIRFRHNLPIVGWLLLRGRCYDCQAAIALRYWLFEVFFAALFAIVGWFFLIPLLPWR